MKTTRHRSASRSFAPIPHSRLVALFRARTAVNGHPLQVLRSHVTGAIERGEAVAIVGIPAR